MAARCTTCVWILQAHFLEVIKPRQLCCASSVLINHRCGTKCGVKTEQGDSDLQVFTQKTTGRHKGSVE